MMHGTERLAETAIGTSAVTATTSFFVATLPVVQWMAAFVAIVSGVIGVAWIVYKFYHKHFRD